MPTRLTKAGNAQVLRRARRTVVHERHLLRGEDSEERCKADRAAGVYRRSEGGRRVTFWILVRDVYANLSHLDVRAQPH